MKTRVNNEVNALVYLFFEGTKYSHFYILINTSGFELKLKSASLNRFPVELRRSSKVLSLLKNLRKNVLGG